MQNAFVSNKRAQQCVDVSRVHQTSALASGLPAGWKPDKRSPGRSGQGFWYLRRRNGTAREPKRRRRGDQEPLRGQLMARLGSVRLTKAACAGEGTPPNQPGVSHSATASHDHFQRLLTDYSSRVNIKAPTTVKHWL